MSKPTVQATSPPTEGGTTRSGRIAIVGRPNVGKSTLLNALLGEPLAITSPHAQTTRAPVRGVLTKGDTQYFFVDTPGLHVPRTRLGHWMNNAAWDAAREADAVVLMVDVPTIESAPARDGARLAKSREVLKPKTADRLLALELAAELPGMPTVLAVNKVDRLKAKSLLLPLLAAFSEVHSFASTVPLSAKNANGVDRLLTELRSVLPEQPFLCDPDTLSDQPERFFVAELVREQILAHTRQEVPHGVAVIVERFDESAKRPRIEVAIHVAREAHKKILVGAEGTMLKTVGTAARQNIERMLGRAVHLQLWVRSTPDWMNDDARMRELGYGRAT